MKRVYLITVYIALVSCVSSDSLNLKQFSVSQVEISGHLENRAINESSGLISSRQNPHLIWTHNDSGDAPLIYALSPQGRHLGQIRISDSVNRDWEDLAQYQDAGAHYLLVADIGDNDAQHRYYRLYIVREPALKDLKPGRTLGVPVERVIRFQYEDGPKDSEAIAVDPRDGNIYILSKRTRPVSVYVLSWQMDETKIQIAKKLTDLKTLPNKRSLFSPFANQVTGMDISADGERLVVLTYANAYLYERGDGSWKQALEGAPRVVPFPRLRQAESICFSAGQSALYIGSEGRRAPLIKIQF